MVLRVKGIDYESLDHASRDYAVKRLEAASRAFDSRVRVYQALLKANEPAIPHREYTNPLVKAAIDQRMAYFAAKADQLYSIDVYWIIVVQGSYAKSTLWEALRKVPTDIGGSLRDVLALFSRDQQRTFLRAQIERDHLLLRQKVSGLIGQLSDLVEIQLQGAEEAFRILRRFINFGPFKIFCSHLAGSRYLDFQLCDSEIEAHRGHLRLDDYYVRVFTLKELCLSKSSKYLRGGELYFLHNFLLRCLFPSRYCSPLCFRCSVRARRFSWRTWLCATKSACFSGRRESARN